ncbi:26392_t:CDS:2, partial [Dentiscutata erythropus]
LEASIKNNEIITEFKQTTNVNLILYTNAMKYNPTISGYQKFYKVPQADNL